MSKKAAEPATIFSKTVADEIRQAIKASGLNNKETLAETGISPNYFYERMRGDKPFNTNDISKIADALGMEAFIILRKNR